MKRKPTFDDIFAVMSAASVGDTEARVAIPDDPQADDLATRFAIALNLLLDDLAFRTAESARSHKRLEAINTELEKRIEERTAHLRAVMDTALDAIVTADDTGHITYFNQAAERLFGYAVSDVRGKPLTLLMPQRFQDAHRKGFARYLATGEARLIGKKVELVGKRRDGSEFPLELSLATWEVSDQRFFTGIIRDITERKRSFDELRRARDNAEATNKELEAFSYSVAHDLRAPLRAIDGFSQAVLEDYADKVDATGQEYLQIIRESAQEMAGLIDDLLMLSRVTRSELRREPVDLAALARSVLTRLQKNEPERRLEVIVSDELIVNADARLMGIVLENLLGNAWKFTGKRPMARIEVGSQSVEGHLAYFVRDNGVGFDMKYVDKLFNAFQRLHSTTEFDGSGIGLATVQRIIRRHGGRVWAEAEVGRGATFYFTLNEAIR